MLINLSVFHQTGENGSAVIIDKDKLSSADLTKVDEGYANYSYNSYVSDMISLHRTLPDTRYER